MTMVKCDDSAPANTALGQQHCLISVIASGSIFVSGIVGPDIHTGNSLALGLCIQGRGRRGCVRDAETIQANAMQRQEPSRKTLAALA
jgi:hypothetical protein